MEESLLVQNIMQEEVDAGWTLELPKEDRDEFDQAIEVLKELPGGYTVLDTRKYRSREEGEEYWVSCISGGDNGTGDWVTYFDNLKNVFKKLEEKGFAVWLICMDNDCVDDIHYVYIGACLEE